MVHIVFLKIHENYIHFLLPSPFVKYTLRRKQVKPIMRFQFLAKGLGP